MVIETIKHSPVHMKVSINGPVITDTARNLDWDNNICQNVDKFVYF